MHCVLHWMAKGEFQLGPAVRNKYQSRVTQLDKCALVELITRRGVLDNKANVVTSRRGKLQIVISYRLISKRNHISAVAGCVFTSNE